LSSEGNLTTTVLQERSLEGVHRTFGGSIPDYYERYLVPFYFTPFAHDLVARVQRSAPDRILELACGTGVVTQMLVDRLSGNGRIVATDLNQAMIDMARTKSPRAGNIDWQVADACDLQFADGSFDVVVCQFGWMFFPDRALAAREAARVLRPGGRLLFNTWDSLAANVVPAEAYAGIRACFATDPPRFYDIPYGMSDPAVHERLAKNAGFADVTVERATFEGARLHAREIATGVIRGGPFITEIEQRGANADEIIEKVAERLKARFGDERFAATLSALVCSAKKPESP
jgi:SAM-dependent methyltransferase